jgi:membrane-anchored glycerophosphoryl diester phosphodiesterase (GDPDase)
MVKPYTEKDKWIIAFILGIMFVLLASPYTFYLSDTLMGCIGVHTVNSDSIPTIFGMLLHGLIFVLLVRWFIR